MDFLKQVNWGYAIAGLVVGGLLYKAWNTAKQAAVAVTTPYVEQRQQAIEEAAGGPPAEVVFGAGEYLGPEAEVVYDPGEYIGPTDEVVGGASEYLGVVNRSKLRSWMARLSPPVTSMGQSPWCPYRAAMGQPRPVSDWLHYAPLTTYGV